MNARIETSATRPPLGIAASALWDDELERNTLGTALLGYPLPDWLQVKHFYAGQHRAIFRAIEQLGSKANLPTVYAYLRDVAAAPVQQPRYERDATGERRGTAPAATSVELVEMMDSADHALRMGWAVEYERLVELWRQRELVTVMRRVEVELTGGVITHREARAALSQHFMEVGR